jgi:hypothetical protein
MKYFIVVLLLLLSCSGNNKQETFIDTTQTEAYSNKYDSLAQYYDSVKLVVDKKLQSDETLIFK